MIVFFKIGIAYIYIEKISRAVPATKNLFYPEISFIIPIFTPIHMKVCIPKLEFQNFVLNDSPYQAGCQRRPPSAIPAATTYVN